MISALVLRGETKSLQKGEEWFVRHGLWALVVCRFVPGTRLPTFLAAGFLGMPIARFALITGLLAAGWVGLVFLLFRWFEMRTNLTSDLHGVLQFMMFSLLALVLFLTRGRWLLAVRRLHVSAAIQRWLKWEFWPAWLFYLPIGIHYLRLALKYRSLSLPTCANPGMYTGGLIGESKHETLQALARTSAEWVAASVLIPAGVAADRLSALEEGRRMLGSDFPIVLKPDVAQRGSGFRVVKSIAEAEDYLSEVHVPIVAQEYVYGPYEAGIFYFRFPDEPAGKIFAITEKVFPVLVGDGRSTVEELIRADARASLLAETYLRRFDHCRTRVLPDHETLRLVEAGNHAQGCIFRDGMRFWSRELEEQVDAISSRLPGFFIGRYDVRFRSIEEFRAGQGFKILELNGASSEATSAYDSGNSLREAYGILFQQWDLVFAIGAANRRRGYRPDAVKKILAEWHSYRRASLCHPLAD